MLYLRACISIIAVSIGIPFQGMAQLNPLSEYNTGLQDTAAIAQRLDELKGMHLTYPDSAGPLLEAVIQHSYYAQFPRGVILGSLWLGSTYLQKGEHDQALLIFQELLKQCNTPEFRRYIAAVLNNTGNAYHYKGQYIQALEQYEQAEKAYTKYGSSTSIGGTIFNNIAVVLIKMQQPRQALLYLEKAEKIAQEHKNYGLYSNALGNRVLAYLQLWDTLQADTVLRKALKVATVQGGPSQRAVVLDLYGLFYLKTGRQESALRYFEEAVQLPVNRSLKVAILGNMGKAWYELRYFAKARDYYEAAEKLAVQTGAAGAVMQLTASLAHTYAALGQYKKAYDFSWAYLDQSDSILGAKNAADIAQFEVKFRTALKDKEMAEQKLLLNKQQQTIERSRRWITVGIVSVMLLVLLWVQFYRNVRNKRRIAGLYEMMKGEEQERIRIGRELHDGVGGMLAAVKMGFSTFQVAHQLEEEKDFNDLMVLLNEANHEMRNTAHNLMPDILVRLGLSQTLTQYLVWKNSIWAPLHIDLQIFGNIDDFPPQFQLMLYRFVQELLKNIVQHAEAQRVLVQLNRDEGERVFSLMVEDDGKGFEQSKATDGIGLSNMKARINALKGTFSVQSEQGKGTIVYMEFELGKINTIL